MSDARELSRRSGCASQAFVSAEEHRLRSGWRILLYSALCFIAWLGAQVAVSLLVWSLPTAHLAAEYVYYGLYLAGLQGATWLSRRVLDRRPFLDLGLRPYRAWWADTLFGVALGALLMAAIYLAERAAGWLQFQSFAWEGGTWQQHLPALAGSCFVYLVVAVNEELVVRGYFLQNLAEGLNTFWGLVLSSAIFGLLHLSNPHASWVSTLNISLAGLFLASGYLVTGSLWLPIGLHFGWNFFQGTVFGFPVSGTDGFHLIRQIVAGPAWATGGAFGPEAGLVGLAAMACGTFLIWLWARLTRARHPTRRTPGANDAEQ